MLRRVALVRTDVSEVFLRSVRRLLVTASVVPSSPILVTLIKEALNSSETSVLTRATRRNIPEDTIFQYTASFTKKAGLFVETFRRAYPPMGMNQNSIIRANDCNMCLRVPEPHVCHSCACDGRTNRITPRTAPSDSVPRVSSFQCSSRIYCITRPPRVAEDFDMLARRD
jgi:hypothetical protein